MRQHNGNVNHPPKGTSLVIDALTTDQAEQVKALLADHRRNLALFCLGISTPLTASELLGLQWLDIDDTAGWFIRHPSGMIPILHPGPDLLRALPHGGQDGLVFPSGRGGGLITIQGLNNMVKTWCGKAGVSGNFGAMSLRKTYLAAREADKVRDAVLKERRRCIAVAQSVLDGYHGTCEETPVDSYTVWKIMEAIKSGSEA